MIFSSFCRQCHIVYNKCIFSLVYLSRFNYQDRLNNKKYRRKCINYTKRNGLSQKTSFKSPSTVSEFTLTTYKTGIIQLLVWGLSRLKPLVKLLCKRKDTNDVTLVNLRLMATMPLLKLFVYHFKLFANEQNARYISRSNMKHHKILIKIRVYSNTTVFWK